MSNNSIFDRFSTAYKAKGAQLDKAYRRRQEKFIESVVRKNTKVKRKSLLDVGCGRGLMLSMLKDKYACTGLDINPNEIKSAKKRVKGVNFLIGNMLDFNLKMEFDIITCFDSIDHGDDLRANIGKTLTNLYGHLRKGGVLIFNLPLVEDCWINENIGVTILSTGNEKFIYITHKCIRNKKFNMDKIIILAKGKNVEKEFKTSIISYKNPQKTREVENIAKRIGFNTSIYCDWSGKIWDKDSKEEPIFVCVKV